MAPWGFGSDENDATHNELQRHIPRHLVIMEQIPDIDKDTLRSHISNLMLTPGVVVWYVKQGVILPETILKNTVQELQQEIDNKWYNDERRDEIEYEIGLLKKCILTNKAEATGVYTYFNKILKEVYHMPLDTSA